MIPKISPMALERLGVEMRDGKFQKFTLNRLVVENPTFSHVVNFVSQKMKSQFGSDAYEISSYVFACSYRLIELAHRYPAEEPKLIDMGDVDPLHVAEEKDVERALREFKELVLRL